MEIRQTLDFKNWFSKLKDLEAKRRISARLVRLKLGLIGDVKPIGAGLSELRIHYGQGYRLYFKQKGSEIIILLCGGDKSTQQKDIEQAKFLAIKDEE